uniref:22 kDa protein n=1 Tax=Arctotis ophiovirus TaxID=2983930 RepID=A0A9N6YK39_9VIRU|nr:TPA_asm: 22 kDa protein [Arctotis ophiovirus]
MTKTTTINANKIKTEHAKSTIEHVMRTLESKIVEFNDKTLSGDIIKAIGGIGINWFLKEETKRACCNDFILMEKFRTISKEENNHFEGMQIRDDKMIINSNSVKWSDYSYLNLFEEIQLEPSTGLIIIGSNLYHLLMQKDKKVMITIAIKELRSEPSVIRDDIIAVLDLLREEVAATEEEGKASKINDIEKWKESNIINRIPGKEHNNTKFNSSEYKRRFTH